jgi:hypothetical protein
LPLQAIDRRVGAPLASLGMSNFRTCFFKLAVSRRQRSKAYAKFEIAGCDVEGPSYWLRKEIDPGKEETQRPSSAPFSGPQP